jgi:hypothetical protein
VRDYHDLRFVLNARKFKVLQAPSSCRACPTRPGCLGLYARCCDSLALRKYLQHAAHAARCGAAECVPLQQEYYAMCTREKRYWAATEGNVPETGAHPAPDRLRQAAEARKRELNPF